MELPTSFTDLLGVPASLIKEAGMMRDDLKKGDYYRAFLEDAPYQIAFIKYPAQAHRLYRWGLDYRSGRPRTVGDGREQFKISKWEAISKTAGFQPVSITKIYKAEESARWIDQYWMTKKRDILDHYTKMHNRWGPDHTFTKAAIRRIQDFNAKVGKNGLPSSYRITVRTIKTRMKKKPSKKEFWLQQQTESLRPK